MSEVLHAGHRPYRPVCYHCSNLFFDSGYDYEHVPHCILLSRIVELEGSCKNFSSWRSVRELKVTLPRWLRWLE